jgi:nucleotide-binding universal stress UspA family protein
MKKILIPTDFSIEADKVLDVAAAIATLTGASIDFLNVIEPIRGDGVSMTGGTENTMDNLFTLKLLEHNHKEVGKRANKSIYMDIATKSEVRVGETYTAIQEYVKENNIDLIIMGSKGSSGLEEVFIGSTAERVTRYSPCPVLIIKNHAETFNLENIVFATNAEPGIDDVIKIVADFQKMFGAKIHILNVNTPNNFYRSRTMMKMLGDMAEAYKLENYTLNVYNDSNEEDGIIHFAEDVHADIIIMGTHARTGLSRLLSSNVSEEVVNHSRRPVITVRIK